MSQTRQLEVALVTGLSGAGRSTVGNALEDLGWYVVDNLPPQMLRPLVELAQHAGNSLPRIAAIVDVRGGKLFSIWSVNSVKPTLSLFLMADMARIAPSSATNSRLVWVVVPKLWEALRSTNKYIASSRSSRNSFTNG